MVLSVVEGKRKETLSIHFDARDTAEEPNLKIEN